MFKVRFGRYPGTQDSVSFQGEIIEDYNGPIESALKKADMIFIPKDPKNDGMDYYYSYDPSHRISKTVRLVAVLQMLHPQVQKQQLH